MSIPFYEALRRARIEKGLSQQQLADAKPQVILVDDERIILTGGLPVLRSAMPGASVTGFTVPAEAVAFAKENPVALAFLDYAFDAWATGACGYMLKPLTAEAVRKWLPRLRHPVRGLEGV